MRPLRIFAIAFLIVAACFGVAKPPFLKVFMSTYKIKPDSNLGRARCLICHLPPGPPKRNPYGKTVQAALESVHARMVTLEILKSVEKKDMGDGATFISKIKSDSLPGVAKAKPVKKPAKKAKHKKHLALLDPTGVAALAAAAIGASALAIRRRR